MADEDSEKTEDPTQKKLDEAIQKGDVAKSQEVGTWFVMASGTLVLMAFSSNMGNSLSTTMRGLLANSWQIPVDGMGLRLLYESIGVHLLAAMAVPILLLVLAAIAGNIIQHRLVWSANRFRRSCPRSRRWKAPSACSPMQAIANLIKGIVKILVLGGVLTALMWPERYRIMAMVRTDPTAILPVTRSLSLKLMGAVVAIMAVVAVADFLFQYRRWYEKQKMSLRDIKEEFKQSEGDPIVKGKQKQIQQQRSRKRMMAQVPKAAVVITNPTHYAIALQYERGMEAPICVAKGVDAVALKIRAIAEEHRIPTVENPPLARALHATVELDQAIPPEHYKAVAEVIGYVMRLRRAASGLRLIGGAGRGFSRRRLARGPGLAPRGRLKALGGSGALVGAAARTGFGTVMAGQDLPRGRRRRRTARRTAGRPSTRASARRAAAPSAWCCWSRCCWSGPQPARSTSAAAMPRITSWRCSPCSAPSACSRCLRSPPASCASAAASRATRCSRRWSTTISTASWSQTRAAVSSTPTPPIST